MIDEAITQRLIERGEAIYYNSSINTHKTEWEDNYLGVSTLVKRTAVEYADRIIKREVEVSPREDGIWAFRGNHLADAYLRPITAHREIQVQFALNPQWRLVGHADGIERLPEGPWVIHECKSHDAASDDNVDLAARQATLYAAMMQSQLDAVEGTDLCIFPLAEFQKDPSAKPIFIYGGAPDSVWGICINISSKPPALVQPIQLGADDIGAVLDFYRTKAEAILKSVADKNLDAARGWDESAEGLQEFKRPLSATLLGICNEDLAIRALEYRDCSQQIKTLEAFKDECSGITTGLLSKADGRAVLVDLPDGLKLRVSTQRSSSGSLFPRVSGIPKDYDGRAAITAILAKRTGAVDAALADRIVISPDGEEL